MNRINYLLIIGLTFVFKSGTAQTFTLLKDIWPGSINSDPHIMARDSHGWIYFYAREKPHGNELWKSDGVITKLIKDIKPGPADGNPNSLIVFNSLLYFVADDGIHGAELWVSNGTPAGTLLLKDINPGASSGCSEFSQLHIFNGAFYFYASDGIHGNELWKSDGTIAGTVMLRDIYVGTGDSNINLPRFCTVGPTLFFAATDGPASTVPGAHSEELWKTDGTFGGTKLVRNINTHTEALTACGSQPTKLTNFNGKLIFDAMEFLDHEPWISDGTSAGTFMLKDINPGLVPVPTIYPFGNSSYPNYFTVMNNYVYFSAKYYPDGQELWRSDGSIPGTEMVKDIYPGGTPTITGFHGFSSSPAELTVLDDKFYFSADNGSGRELWVSDGTTAGTMLFEETNPDPTVGGNPELLTRVNDKIYFRTDNGVSGVELWSADGTPGGTMLVQDIEPGPVGSFPEQIFQTDSKIFVVVTTSPYGRELWVADISASRATYVVKSKLPGGIFNNSAEIITNPVENEINLNIRSTSIDKIKWQLIDNLGRVVRSGFFTIAPGTTLITENTGNLAAGNYLLRLDGKNLNQTFKVIRRP